MWAGAAPPVRADDQYSSGADAADPIRRRQDAHAHHALPPARSGDDARSYPGIAKLLADVLLPSIPKAKLGVFVGNAWIRRPAPRRHGSTWPPAGRRRRGGAAGASGRHGAAWHRDPAAPLCGANAPVLLLFDEVLNFVNRHRNMGSTSMPLSRT